MLSGAAAVALAGCAQNPPPEAKHFFPEAAARHLFADGYRHVQDRFVEPITADTLAYAGLEGLSVLAPDIKVRRSGNRVELIAGNHAVQEFAMPTRGDSEEWGRTTAAVLQASWSLSPTLRQSKPEQIYSTMFSGLLEKLDGYSRYTDAVSAEQARASREGFGGIGISIQGNEGQFTVARVLPDTPAKRAGLRENDVITEIDGDPVVAISQSDVIERLRGPVDSQVIIAVRRGAKPLRFAVTRAHIVPQTVTYKREGDVAYLRLSSFNRHTTSEMRRAIADARQELGASLKGIILDLRGNPGGLLDQAVSVADLFLRDGTIVATRGRHPASNSVFSASGEDIADGIPMVVLVNGKSASASEMLAAALQDWGRAVIVGSASHGKGSVQNVIRMPNGGEIIITWSRMYAPSGYVLDRLGVYPAICTSNSAVDPVDGLRDGRRPGDPDFIAWHGYVNADDAAARTLRLSCPAEQTERESDVTTAQRVLHEPRTYKLALRPWTGSTMTAANPTVSTAKQIAH